MDHHLGVGAQASTDDFKENYFTGRRNNGIYIPRFRNIGRNSDNVNSLRGYGYQGGGGRSSWSDNIAELSYGADFKEAIMSPGDRELG